MDVAVLNPQDCLQNPLKPTRNHNRFNRQAQTHRRKRSPHSSSLSLRAASVSPPKNLAMDEVKILKRGEDLKATIQTADNPTRSEVVVAKIKDPVDLGSTERLGPEPQKVQAQMSLFYAGTAFITSPPPSSLPLPGFTMKKNSVGVQRDDATTGLCRILGLSL